MIKFFRKIRKKLLAEGKTRNYIKYAIGEIILVVIGILIALQINNWNEDRKAKNDFEFGLKQVYTQIQVNYFDLISSKERVEFQLKYIDSLINYSDHLKQENLPGIIQLLDYLGLSSDTNQSELIKPFLKLSINDEVQNELAKSLGKNFYNATYFESNQSFNFQNQVISINLFDHLKSRGIPLRFMDQSPVFREFILPPNKDFYSTRNLEDAAALLNDPLFLADLKTIQYLKKEYFIDIHEIENIHTSTLEYLARHYPSSVNKIDYMEIIGSGTPNSNWAIGDPMNQISEGVFEIESELLDGEIKFRTDQNYTCDWGGSQFNMAQLSFKGTDIKTSKGFYLITIDINNLAYSITPIFRND